MAPALLPPFEVGIGRRTANPVFQFFGEAEVLDVAVPEKHVLVTPSLKIMPLTALVDDAAVGVPWPIALNDLVGRAAADLRRLDRCGFRCATRSF